MKVRNNIYKTCHENNFSLTSLFDVGILASFKCAGLSETNFNFAKVLRSPNVFYFHSSLSLSRGVPRSHSGVAAGPRQGTTPCTECILTECNLASVPFFALLL